MTAPMTPGRCGAAIDALALAVRPGGRLADADFDGALARALEVVLDGRPGILWIVTNNKNSRNNSPEINRNTRAFAELVRSSPYLPFAAAYPVRMPVTGRQYSERGLILYAIAYGDDAAAELQRVVDSAPMRALFTDPPFRLKHLDQAPLTFTVTGGDRAAARPPCPAAASWSPAWRRTDRPRSASPARCGRTTTRRPSSAPTCPWPGRRWTAWRTRRRCRRRSPPRTLSRLAAGTEQGSVTLTLHPPALAREPGLAGLLARTRVLNGTLRLRLTNLSLALGEDFRAKMGEIAALDQLPDVFADYQRVTEAAASIPVVLVVQFSAWPLALAVGGGALLLAALAGAALLAARARRYPVAVEGGTQTFALRPFQSQTVPLGDGRRLVVTGRLVGAHRCRVVDASPARGKVS